MQINMSKSENSILIVIEGEIDEQGAKTMKQIFIEAFNNTIKEVTFDFKNVTHIGSAGIGKLLLFYKEVAIGNGQINIINTPSHIINLLKSMKLDSIFSMSS